MTGEQKGKEHPQMPSSCADFLRHPIAQCGLMSQLFFFPSNENCAHYFSGSVYKTQWMFILKKAMQLSESGLVFFLLVA